MVAPDRDVGATEPPKPRSVTSERAALGHTWEPAGCGGPKVRPRPCSARHRHAAETEALARRGSPDFLFPADAPIGQLSLLMILPCGLQFQDLQPQRCNLVSTTSADQPPSSDHLMRSLLATNRVAAAGVVEPASSVGKVSV